MSAKRLAVLSLIPDTLAWTLHLPSSTFRKLKQTKMLRLGAEKKSFPVSLSSRQPASASIHSKVMLDSLHHGWVAAGPILGILTVKWRTDFKGNKKNFRDIIRTGKKLGALVYVFAAEDIHWRSSTTKAYFYHEWKGKWVSVDQMPLPDVVYNRIPYREDEEREYVQRTLKKLRSNSSIHLFNQGFFNKWDLYQILGRSSEVNQYIPESKRLSSFKEFKDMLDSHSFLYLKPISGKAGQGIMSIESHPKQFVLKQTVGGSLLKRTFRNPMQLWSHVRSQTKGGYIVQQGIRLCTYNGRPFDFRVLVQKDDSGSWQFSGIGIRVAGRNSITTHVPRGGSIASPEEALKEIFPDEQYSLFISRLKTAVLAIASSLEHSFKLLGEISMDIGLDQDGNIWFFEANSKPMKFDEPHIRKISLERLIQYAQYLSHFK